jgi:hypothetical protein
MKSRDNGLLKVVFLIMICIFHKNYSIAQNMITNWSFEDTLPCVSPFPYWGMPETAPPWKSLSKTPDYFSLDYCGGGAIGFGFQQPHSGNALVHFAAYSNTWPWERESIGQELNDSLISGHTYCVSFYVSLTEYSQNAISSIGALFTSFEVDQAYIMTFTATPQIQNPLNNIISDTANWILISGSFVAQGGERYISICNFLSDSLTPFVQVNGGIQDFASYYIDDISVIDCSVGIPENMADDFKIYPNPIRPDQKLTITSTVSNYQNSIIKIFDSNGKMLLIKEFQNIAAENSVELNLESGFYLVQISDRFNLANFKLIVL